MPDIDTSTVEARLRAAGFACGRCGAKRFLRHPTSGARVILGERRGVFLCQECMPRARPRKRDKEE